MEWLNKHWTVLAGIATVLAIAAYAIADERSSSHVSAHNNRETAHPAQQREIQRNNTRWQVTQQELKNIKESNARIERMVERLLEDTRN